MKRTLVFVGLLVMGCGERPIGECDPVDGGAPSGLLVRGPTHGTNEVATARVPYGLPWSCALDSDHVSCGPTSGSGVYTGLTFKVPAGTTYHEGDQFKPIAQFPWDIEVDENGRRVYLLQAYDPTASARVEIVHLRSASSPGEVRILGSLCPGRNWAAEFSGVTATIERQP